MMDVRDGVEQGLNPVALAQHLIRQPSITPDATACLDALQAVLRDLGFACTRLPYATPDTPDVDNLFARWDSTPGATSAGRHFCFAGHVDVVPPGDTAAWSHDPFAGVVKNGVLHGRGAADMKGAIAAFVVAFDRWRRDRADGAPPASVSLLITGDEEGPAINGTDKVLDWMAEHGHVPDTCLVGEPTNPRAMGEMIKIGRRGSLNAWLTVHGRQGHIAYPHLADNPVHRLVAMLQAVISVALDDGSAHFQPSSLQVATIDVGNPATNVIPAAARATFNIRFNDHHTGRSLEDWLRQRFTQAAGAGGHFDLDVRVSGESFLTPPGELTEVVVDAVNRHTGRRPELSTTGGTSDARFIRRLCPVVECGLVGRTIHQVNEQVPVADIETLTAIYGSVLQQFLDHPPGASR